ncbi:MAG TPA: CBS domain-containing protein [Stellaceae bacterium]|jgi:CBS domain-containing protein|nr:CBS domain-containing protein [Stellaceae bacterium]
MNAKECMSKDVQMVTPDQTIADAARAMKNIDAGFLPVRENDRLVGMITDRDIALRAVAEDKGPDTPIREVMSGKVLYCFEDEDLDDVAVKFSELQVRRMPVLNRDKRLVGIISLADISRSDGDGQRSAAALGGISRGGTGARPAH